MTVCIAAVCSRLKKVVTVTDEMISDLYGEISVEGVNKHRFLNSAAPWVASYAGNAQNATGLLRRIASRVKEAQGQGPEAYRMPLPGDTIAEICENVYADEVLRIVESEVLLPYGMGRAEFFASGRERLTEYQFTTLVETIKVTHTDVTMLIAGFDQDNEGRIFEVSPWGVVKEQPLSYHAIGAGRTIALGSLYQFGDFTNGDDLNEIVYRVCAAKFAAERAPSVGENTFLFVQGLGGRTLSFLLASEDDESDGIAVLRHIWLTEGQPPVPSTALRHLQTHLQTFELDKMMADIRSRPEERLDPPTT